MPAPTAPPHRRAQTYRFSRTQSAAPPQQGRSAEASSSADLGLPPTPRKSSDAPYRGSSEEYEKEQQRLKAAAAAKLAEEAAWEKTRGAGSAVLDLLKLPELGDEDEQDSRSGSSGEQLRPSSRSITPGSGSNSGTSGISASGSANGTSHGKGSSNDSSSNSSQTDLSQSSKSKRKVGKLSKTWEAARVLPSLDDVQARHHDVLTISSADKLLSRGISEYTLLPKILGRGKFSSVFLASKPHGPTGESQLFAIKHTPLFPHHPLIATRLLREPTLLAELPPHPNLVNVYETIRTPGHFYLVEEYLNGYVTLEALLPMRSEQSPPHLPILPTGVANCVLDQLLSAVHAIHHPLQICHRDIKPENILVHPDTLQLKLLDFGLATHFSRSEAKLSTCCGSPAFHCPEIVTALRNPVGTVHYWGPEVDAWTCGITMLRLLTGIRYPIGASHTSVRSMSIRAQRAVATIHDPELRDRIGKLLEVNGERRMRNFEDMVQALESSTEQPQPRGVKDFKSTTFIPVEPQHKMNLPLVIGPAAEAALTSPLLPSGATPNASKMSTPMNSRPASPNFANADVTEAHLSPAPTLLLSNPSHQPAQRVLSYIKYCLRCAGILYHCWPDTGSSTSLPSTPGPFEAAFQDYNNAVTNGSSTSSETTPLSAHPDNQAPASVSPSTPFPIQAARSERDPYSHIHVFECVLEIVNPPQHADDQEPQSLMQSIFSALSFGSRPANRRSLSTPPKTENARAAGLPRPPGTPADAPVSGSGSASGKPGDVKCLTFYLVLRFPRRPAGQVSFVASRPSYSRSSSVASFSHRTRSRASSAVGADRDAGGLSTDTIVESRTRPNKLQSSQSYADLATGIHPLRKAMIDSNHTTPRASRTSSPAVSHGDLRKRERSRTVHHEQDQHRRKAHDIDQDKLGLTIETSPELLRIAEKQASAGNSPGLSPRSAPNSRSTSRARSRKSSRTRAASASHRAGGSNKIFVHVTDTRALDAVRRALSIGGTTTDYNPDVELENDDLGATWSSPDLRTRDAAFAEEFDQAIRGGLVDHKHRRPTSSRRRTQSQRLASGLAAAVAENASVGAGDEPGQNSRPTWADVPSGAMKPRSTISHGSDDQEQYTRGRSLGPASNLNAAPTGIPFAAAGPRLRASSNLAFAVVQEESSPSNTERSASLSKTMLDLRDKPDPEGNAASSVKDVASTTSSGDFDLVKQVSALDALTGGLLTGNPLPSHDELLSAVSGVADFLLHLQTQDVARFAQELDSASFDLFKALSPVTGLVDRSSGAPVQVSTLARQVLDLLGETASSREVYMAIDMRCGEMLVAEPRCVDPTDGEQLWGSAAEAIYMMRLLNTVLPRIRTKKPQGFSQVFARLPQCLMLGFASIAAHAKGASEVLVEEAVKTCCSTALICVDWEAHCTGSTERESVRRTSREALGRFLQGITVCLPYLAGSNSSLSEEFFFTQNPRYALSKREPSAVRRNESLFAEISKTLASLEVDLGTIWSHALAGMSRDPEDEETRETLTALGVAGFVLHVHLLYSGYARDRPSDWKGVRAQTQLELALPVALLAVSEQTKAAASPDLAEGKEDALADTSLLWMQWCWQGLQQETRMLPTELAVSLAQTLATQSVISPSPGARLVRFKLLSELLVDRCEPKAGLTVIEQLITGSPFAQLRAGAVSILRTWLAKWLSNSASGEAVSVQMLVDLLKDVLKPPASDAAAELAEESGRWTELLSLVYWLETQHQSSTRVGEVYAELRECVAHFVASLGTRLGQLEAESEEEGRKLELLRVALQSVKDASLASKDS
uniref:Protein kinase n=2 Tax=Kalmanozyma brasiliensis (strain GHG001) TaxID=1365824 RepID=V5EU64_KALBG